MRHFILAAALLLPGAAFAQTAPQQPIQPGPAALQQLGIEHAFDVLQIQQLKAQVADLEQQLAAAKAAAPKTDLKKDH